MSNHLMKETLFIFKHYIDDKKISNYSFAPQNNGGQTD